jgi:uncharacterized protein (DUF2236 family)
VNLVKRYVREDFTNQAGRHDSPEVFAAPEGDPGLIGPGTVSWEIHSDIASVAVAGTAAIAMELLHPSVMAGVGQQSRYREQPYRRAQTTFGWVITTTFGSTQAATDMIERVKRMHGRVNGVRADGVAYRALDPELIAWVHTCIPWAVMTAYERFNRPLSTEQKDAYLHEQSIVALLSGADEVPTTVADLEAYFEDMRPQLEYGPLTHEFFEFLIGGPLGALVPPAPLAGPVKRFQVEAGVSLMPRWAQELTGLDRPVVVQRLMHQRSMHAYARLLRWATGTPPWRELADARVGAGQPQRRPSPVLATA